MKISIILFRKQNFSGNAYLNGLQQQSNYFRFQYFNPLKSERYYRNLDEQVLALITGEIGSMPDLKKPKISRIQNNVHLSLMKKMILQLLKNKKIIRKVRQLHIVKVG